MKKAARTAVTALSLLLAACGGGGGGDGGGAAQTTGATQSNKGSGDSTQKPVVTPTIAPTNDPAAIALFAPAGAAAAPATVTTGDIVNDSFAYINARRAELNLSALKYVSAVGVAAANHARYMQAAGAIGHYETAGQPYFSGVKPSDRVAAAGYTTNSTGEIAAGYGGGFLNSIQAIDALFDAPFHRSIFLFDTTSVGIGQVPTTDPTQYATLVADFVDYVAATPDNRLIAYPYDGQTNVKPSWIANESPNPMARVPQYIMKSVGYPVTLNASGNGAFSNVRFAITDVSGNPVPCEESDNSNNEDSTRLALCVPYAPLAANSRYFVTVTGSLTNTSITTATAFSVSWSFTTGAALAATNKAQGRSRLPMVLE
ncbi:CAP domain-containing protein [Caballeronia sp. LZ065]|uniref:CAP domain-containing protein n=1 Tax=Caballeronia sp. LZ065 TaxID=3038571 RepID=UPI0028656E40|nr:CAP domain-containing protein [Caballeronia sp. LZ065]MDR5781455.1 CAP domain-containing protein [Caballeronia sp. LZ065]